MTACVLPSHDQRAETLPGLLLCRRHRDRIDSLTQEIGNLIVDTQRIRDGGAPQDQSPKTRRVKAAEAPAPLDLTIAALYDRRTATTRLPGTVDNPKGDQSEPIANVLHTVASWLLLVAEERPLSAELPRSVLGQLDLLTRHHDWIAAQSFVDDYVSEFETLRKGLRAAVRDREFTTLGRCDLAVETDDGAAACGGALTVRNGESVIRCRRCRAQWVTAQEIARLRVRL